MAEQFIVAYNGRLAEGRSLDAVKRGVAQLFKVDVAKIAHLFNGQWTPIKRGIDQATAIKYQQALARAGALSKVVTDVQFAKLKAAPVASKAAPTAKTAPTRPSTKTKATAAVEPDLERSIIKAAPVGLGALEGIAVEANWDHLEEPDNSPPPQVDLSGVTLGERGADLVAHQHVADVNIDTGELSIDVLGADMVEHEDIPDLVVDMSNMGLDELGVDMSDHLPVEKPDIDISGLSLEPPRSR